MDMTQDIIDKSAKELADAIDWEILANVCLEQGWTEVVVENYHCKYNNGMAEWIFSNIKGDKTGYRGRWLFKRATDATWFRIMWV